MARELVKVIETGSLRVNNIIQNGGMNFWQRGTSIAGTSTFSADRWRSDGETGLVQQQITTNPFTLKQMNYAQIFKNGTTNPAGSINQFIESSIAEKLANERVTVSFLFKKELTSAQDFYPFLQVATPDVKDDWTGSVTYEVALLAPVLATNDFNLFIHAFDAPTGFERGALLTVGGYSTTTTNTDLFDIGISEVMMHRSRGLDEFVFWEPAGGSLVAEEELVRRYYQKIWCGIEGYTGAGASNSMIFNYPVEMRATPTVSGIGAVQESNVTSRNYEQITNKKLWYKVNGTALGNYYRLEETELDAELI